MTIKDEDLKALAVKYGVNPLNSRVSRPPHKNNGMPYWDYCKENEPVYYMNIMNKINKLGHITLLIGHNWELDKLKDYLWGLIGLKD